MSYFSVIVACYNSKNIIDKLFDSLNAQNEDIEVIMCDDSDNEELHEYLPILVDRYKNINIKYIKREGDYKYHSPGNTRHYAMQFATGEWLTFSDHDDFWSLGSFDIVRKAIEETGEKKFLRSGFREVDPDTNEIIQEQDGSIVTWLHGKFYNRQWLVDNNINFKPDLYTHEDLYFNARVMSELESTGSKYTILNVFTYNWVANPNSLTRAFFREDHFFIEVYLNDYIQAAAEPFITCYERHPDKKEYCYNQLVSVFLYSYFYYQSFLYRLGDNLLPENIGHISMFLHRILDTFKVTRSDVLNSLLKDPETYTSARKDAMYGGGQFIETKSIVDFVNSL